MKQRLILWKDSQDDKRLAELTKRQREKTQINKVRDKKEISKQTPRNPQDY
jgi:hypothetical protein